MPSDPSKAGRIGGKSKSAAKLAAARRNGFQKGVAAVLIIDRKPTLSEAELHEIVKKYLPEANEAPEPVVLPKFDELESA